MITFCTVHPQQKDSLFYDIDHFLPGSYLDNDAGFLLFFNNIPLYRIEYRDANFSAVPSGAIEEIKISRGYNSLISLSSGNTNEAGFGAGSFGTIKAHAKYTINSIKMYSSYRESSGYREQDGLRNFVLGGSWSVINEHVNKLTLFTNVSFSGNGIPGPLPDSIYNIDEKKSLPFFRYDQQKNNTYIIGAAYQSRRFNFSLGAENRNSRNTVTLIDNPAGESGELIDSLFGDTKTRDFITTSFFADGDYRLTAGMHKISVSGRYKYGALSFDVNDYLYGFANAYAADEPLLKEINQGNGKIFQGITKVQDFIKFSSALSLTAALEYHNQYHTYNASNGSGEFSFGALVPSARFNLDYQSFNFYLSYSRAFDPPSFMQTSTIFTRKSLNVSYSTEGPVYQIGDIVTYSNPQLKAATGNNFDAGLYFYLPGNLFDMNFSAEGYYYDISNEDNYDVEKFMFVNIGNVLYSGMEASLKVRIAFIGLFADYSARKNKYLSEPYSDKTVKGIPAHSINAGAFINIYHGVKAGASLLYNSSSWLDEMNTSELEGYHVLNLFAGYTGGRFTGILSFENILDKRTPVSGYLLHGRKYLYPLLPSGLSLQISMLL